MLFMQKHTIILWKRPKRESFEIMAKNAFEIIAKLNKFGDELKPKYLTSFKKSECKEFDMTYSSFKNILRDNVSREGKMIFEDLGYNVSFFSSMEEDESATIDISVGISNEKFYNTLIVGLPYSLNIFDEVMYSRLVDLFKELVGIFDPFWGCIENDINIDRFDGELFQGSKPTTVHWLNYFGQEIIKEIGMGKIEKAPIEELVQYPNGGCFVKIKTSPINDHYDKDVFFQKQVNKYLGL